jgi:hypothetical protein
VTKAKLVTGYIRLDSAHRSHESYVEFGNRLLGLGLPATVYHEVMYGTIRGVTGQDMHPTSLDRCWLRMLAASPSVPPGNPDKDTAGFLAVQAEKSAWIARAARGESPDTRMVWVDFGVLHVPGVTETEIVRFFDRAASAPADRITVASIWGPPEQDIDPTSPAWHFAGGVLIVPASLASWFHAEVVRHAEALLATEGMITWEVNYWAAVALANPEKFRWYPSNHDGSLFENGP